MIVAHWWSLKLLIAFVKSFVMWHTRTNILLVKWQSNGESVDVQFFVMAQWYHGSQNEASPRQMRCGLKHTKDSYFVKIFCVTSKSWHQYRHPDIDRGGNWHRATISFFSWERLQRICFSSKIWNIRFRNEKKQAKHYQKFDKRHTHDVESGAKFWLFLLQMLQTEGSCNCAYNAMTR